MRTVIGIDYGTQSARAVLVDADSGNVLASHSVRYPHGVMEGSLASTEDYECALMELLKAVTPEVYRASIRGICVDATSLTLVPVSKDGRALALIPEYADRTHAQIKLWKRHTAQAQADEAMDKAYEMNEAFLGRTGCSISSEWMLPKLLEIRDEDPELYGAIDIAFDLPEYLTWRLTGELTRSVQSMSFKCLYAQDLGLPSAEYLDALRPGFAKEYYHLLRGPVLRTGERAGLLSPEFQRELGLGPDVVVACSMLDGHTGPIAIGAMSDGDVGLVLGTSNVLTFQTRTLSEIPGICGIAPDGMLPGLYGIDAGQACTGDMLDWYMHHFLPESVFTAAKAAGVSAHELLGGRISEPWTNPVCALDWWNGSRNAPCDLSLRGAMFGLSLDTRAEHIYLALLQAIVCGSREIIELLRAHGVSVRRIVATGGIANKNPLLMQQYADILGMPISVARATEGPALGAAIFAAVASGIHPTPLAAYTHMGERVFTLYQPDSEHRADYEALYARGHNLRCLLQNA